MRNKLSVFMVGWEYPPYNSGGLGVACDGLTRALSDQGTQIYFTLPYSLIGALPHMQVLNCASFEDQNLKRLPFFAYDLQLTHGQSVELSIEQQVRGYAQRVKKVAKSKKADLIHAHDWMSFPAAQAARQSLGKPMIAHVHSTEFDRIPSGNGSNFIYQTEKDGLEAADKIVAVSEYTKQILITKYSIAADKIEVVYNGIDPLAQSSVELIHFAPDRPLIVFMGRLAEQKGAWYFIDLAQEVLTQLPNSLFVLAGQGEEYRSLLFKAAGNNLSASVLFSGFLRGREKEILLSRTDIFVMPSLSEPFGIVALEAAQRHIPVIISNNSGVSEVLNGAIEVDFWDTKKMAAKILALLGNLEYKRQVIKAQDESLAKLSWQRSALKMRKVYSELL